MESPAEPLEAKPENTTEQPISPEEREAKKRKKYLDFLIEGNYYSLPRLFKAKTLEMYEDKKVAEICKQTILDGKSLFLSGPAGTGKTHLACSLIYEYALQKKDLGFPQAIFLPSVDLFLELKAGFTDKVPEEDIIYKYGRAAFLVLDDLGVEQVSDWSRGILYALIDLRYRQMRQTVITSNLSLKKISETIDDRIASRIVEMATVVEMKGPDYRIKRKSNIKIV